MGPLSGDSRFNMEACTDVRSLFKQLKDETSLEFLCAFFHDEFVFMSAISAPSKSFVKYNTFGWGYNSQWRGRHEDYIWYSFIWFLRNMNFVMYRTIRGLCHIINVIIFCHYYFLRHIYVVLVVLELSLTGQPEFTGIFFPLLSAGIKWCSQTCMGLIILLWIFGRWTRCFNC